MPMNITEEWRIYDPEDTRTHPEGFARVEIEFQDGRVLDGQYSRDLGLFAAVGSAPANTRVKRWRYSSKSPDK